MRPKRTPDPAPADPVSHPTAPFSCDPQGPGASAAYTDESPAVYDEEQIRELFNTLDTNKNGSLDVNEVRRIASVVNPVHLVPDSTVVDRLLESTGVLKDGKVTFAEFELIMLRLSSM
eukprot:Sspe_Gene.113901::Locus_98691_Transcript_1_1_Confidence_1.000_Length_550::g.113901::m.113901